MNVLQEAKLNMQRGIEHHHDAKIPIIETVRAFSTTFNNQKAFNAEIKSATSGKDSPRTGFTAAKRATRTAFGNTTLIIAKPRRANDIGNNLLLNKSNYTNAEIAVIKLTKTVKNNTLGNYSIKPAPIGKFTIRVQKAGFTDFEVFDFDIKLGEITTLNVELVSS